MDHGDEERAMLQASSLSRVRGAWRRASVAAALALPIAACSGNVQVHGNMPDPELVSEIQPGNYGRRDVAGLLGSPSTVSTFEDSKWYYVGERTSKFAFFKPKVLERNILVVSFDDNGLVADTRTYTLADGREIDPVDRITPTEGRDLTILQQLIGNLGRFSPESVQDQ